MAESDTIGPLVAVERASLSGVISDGDAAVIQCEREVHQMSGGTATLEVRCEARKYTGSPVIVDLARAAVHGRIALQRYVFEAAA
ncbi:hypothetical protein [Mycolicibacterium sp. XJ870]